MAKPGKSSGKTGITFLMLFGLPFLAVGLFMGWLVLSTVTNAWRARSWIETPAQILSTKLEDHGDSDGSTYRVTARYHYRFGNQDYECDRVGLSSGADNIGSWQQTTYQRLKTAHERQEKVSCYVNPHRPSEALLDRQPRLGMLYFELIFVVVFGGVGGGLMIGGLFASRSAKINAALEAEHPGSPWLHRPDWASGRIPCGLRTKELGMWAFGIFWSSISSGVLFIIPGAIANGQRFAIIFLIFPIVGIGLLSYAMILTARRRRFGRSYLLLETIPGVIGGHLRGRVCVVGSVEGIEHITLTLKSKHEYTTGSGKSRTTHTDVLWSEEAAQDCASTFGQTQLDVPFDFQIPHDCSATEKIATSDKIEWNLEVHSVLAGADLALGFEVPVFRTKDSDDRVGVAPARQRKDETLIAAAESPLPGKIVALSDTNGNPQYHISCFPSFGFVTMFGLFALGCLAVAGYAFSCVKDGDWFMLIFLLAFGGVGLLLVFALATALGSYRLTLKPGGLTTERFWLLMRWQREVSAEEVNSVELKQCASSGESKWYEVFCRAGGRRVTLARNVKGELASRWLIRRIEEHLSKPAQTLSNERPQVPAAS